MVADAQMAVDVSFAIINSLLDPALPTEFGILVVLGDLADVLQAAGTVIRFRPPDDRRLQYLTCGAGASGSLAPGDTNGQGESGIAMALQDGYGPDAAAMRGHGGSTESGDVETIIRMVCQACSYSEKQVKS